MSGGLGNGLGRGLDSDFRGDLGAEMGAEMGSDYAENLTKKMGEILDYLQSQGCPKQIHAAVILGSGLGEYTEALELSHSISYSEIPSFPQSTVEGHSGALIFGELQGHTIMAFSGRFHFYEGYGIDETVIPVRLTHALGASKLLISNAAGGINLSYKVGDLMVIDHIIRPHRRMMQQSTRWHWNMKNYADLAFSVATELGLSVHRGNYLYVFGPNYETKAEIHAYRAMGGDAVGMSTAAELMEAARLGLPAVGVSLITNAAAGITGQALNHDEVKEAANARKEDFARLVSRLIVEDWG